MICAGRVMAVIILVILTGVTPMASPVLPKPTRRTTVNISATNLNMPCSYVISTDGIYYYARDCATDSVIYGGANNASRVDGLVFADVIESTVRHGCLVGCHVVIKNGTYVVSRPLYFGQGHDGVHLEGSGLGTKLVLKPSFNGVAAGFEGADWIVENFMINATNQVKGKSYETIGVRGRNNTVSGLYIVNPDHGGIRLSGDGDAALNNAIFNATDDGIILSGKGTHMIASGNFINKTTNHNGISLVTTSDDSVTSNVINYAGGTGIALENLGGGPCRNVLISDNLIQYPGWRGREKEEGGFGGVVIYSYDAADNVTIANNTIVQSQRYGIFVPGGSGYLVSKNRILDARFMGVYLKDVGCFLTSTNYIERPKTGIYVELGTPCGRLLSNIIVQPLGSGIQLNDPNGTMVSGNRIEGIASSAYGVGINIKGGRSVIVSSNYMNGSATYGIILNDTSRSLITDNTFDNLGENSIAIDEQGGSKNNQIVVNYILATTATTIATTIATTTLTQAATGETLTVQYLAIAVAIIVVVVIAALTLIRRRTH